MQGCSHKPTAFPVLPLSLCDEGLHFNHCLSPASRMQGFFQDSPHPTYPIDPVVLFHSSTIQEDSVLEKFSFDFSLILLRTFSIFRMNGSVQA